jgi:large subunit ribosomal protein L18
MNTKKQQRIRRATRARAKIKQLRANRLCVYRSNKHVAAQLISPCGTKTLASASSVDKTLREQLKKGGGNKEAAMLVGKLIAERAIAAGCQQVAFDRSGFKFHGRVKALADAAREAGLQF